MNKFFTPKILQNKISFDFDGTLTDDYDGTPNPKKFEIQHICKSLISQGKDVCIITKRYGPNSGMNEENIVYKLAHELGVEKVYFTDRVLKDKMINKLGIQFHFENSTDEAEIIKLMCPNTTVVNIEDSYWRDLVY